MWNRFAQSYEIAKHDSATYERLARNAREKMFRWCSDQAVAPRLHDALESVCQTPAERADVVESHPRTAAA